jgi:hypothetical protein
MRGFVVGLCLLFPEKDHLALALGRQGEAGDRKGNPDVISPNTTIEYMNIC